MATKTSSSLSLFSSPLTIDQLIDVLDLLKRCGFPQTKWYELGLKLGLHKDTVDILEAVFSGDVSRCLTECLSKWLCRADNVDSKGGATFDSLSDALKSMNENAAADKLDQESKIALNKAVVRPVTSSIVNHLPTANTPVSASAHQSMFDEIRGNFIILIDELVPLISQSKASVDEMKSFLQRLYPELSAELSDADSIEAVINIAVKKCRINNISIIKTIVKRFKINRAKHLISEYEKEVKTVSGSLKDFLSQNQLEHFLICETIQFTLGWEPEEHSLDDIRNLLEEAFKELNKRIIVRSIHRGNSIIIICYGPHHLLAALLLEAQDNLTVLMKEFSLIRLTVGHYTVYDKRIRYKVMNNECLAEEIKLADGEEQELRTLLDYKEGSIFEQDKLLNIIKRRKEYIERTLQIP
uniref:Death domain-containing protein n=1 Tax=Amphimedon queenslandica TaxID=400682 RepID=A0A1X7TJ63_AMPQE